jgi:hypothetical protein
MENLNLKKWAQTQPPISPTNEVDPKMGWRLCEKLERLNVNLKKNSVSAPENQA